MSRRIIILSSALFFLAAAVVSGNAVSSRLSVDTFRNIEAMNSGLMRLRHFLASALYLQLDDYHHIEMYQGISWTQATDYLPQMWLIAKLDPNFTDVYTDAAFHLAVNLGEPEKGMEFIREGLRNNPESLDILFEYAFLLWVTETGTHRDVMQSSLDYLSLLRRSGGDEDQPFNESSATSIIAEVFEARADSLDPYSILYHRRAAFILEATQAGLYYEDYLEPAPEILMPLETENPQ